MKANKQFLILGLVAIAITIFISNIGRNMKAQKENSRLQEYLTPVIAKSLEGTADPKPQISFVVATENSALVVLKWEQNSDASIKNAMREQISQTIRRELAADPGSWGRYIAVIFDNEVVTQGGH